MPLRLLFIVVTCNAVIGQLLLRRAANALGGAPTSLATMPRFVAQAALSPWIYASVAVQVVGYALWLVIVSREKLGVATASIGAGFYVLMALSAWAVYGETLTALQWVGIVLVTAGVVCVSQGAMP
jgi:drug/metabolite transporter (DMT)-like permease